MRRLREGVSAGTTPLYASIFLVSLGLGSYLFLLPIYVQRLGGAYLDLGLVGAVRSLAYVLLPLMAGYLSDRLGALRLYMYSIWVNAAAAGLLVLAASVTQVVLIQVLTGIGYAFLWPTTESLVVSSSDGPRRVRALGRYSISWGSGFLLGPLLGGFISEGLGFTALFLAAAATIMGGLIFLPPLRTTAPFVDSGDTRGTPSLGLLRPALPVYLLVIPYSIVFGLLVAIFPGYLNQLGFSTPAIGGLFTTFGVARLLAFSLVHRVVGLGEKGVLTMSIAAFSTALTLIVIAGSPLGLGLSMALLGFSTGIFYPVTAALASRAVPQARLGTALGAYENFFGIGFMVGPILGGTLATLWGPSSPYLAMAIVWLLALPTLLLWRRPP